MASGSKKARLVMEVVMYHYVRELGTSKYPRLKALDRKIFDSQIEKFATTRKIVNSSFVLKAFEDSFDASNSMLLTFDDGYKEHLDLAYFLSKRKLSGVFFPVTKAISDGDVLDVNKIHFLLEKCQSYEVVADLINDFIHQRIADSKFVISELKKKFYKPNRFDSAIVNYIKRTLQVGLPYDERKIITDLLFKKFVSLDTVSFSNELYLNQEDLLKMRDMGMEIGSHGHSHSWLGSANYFEQIADVEESLSKLKEWNLLTYPINFSYPYGSYNEETISILKKNGVDLAYTVNPHSVCFDGSTLEISRYDTNDFNI